MTTRHGSTRHSLLTEVTTLLLTAGLPKEPVDGKESRMGLWPARERCGALPHGLGWDSQVEGAPEAAGDDELCD